MSEDAGPYIEHHLISSKLGLIEDHPRAAISGHAWIRHAADDFVPDVVAIELRRFLPACGRRRIEARPELLPPRRGLTNQTLRVLHPRVELPLHPSGDVVSLAGGSWEAAAARQAVCHAGRPKKAARAFSDPGNPATIVALDQLELVSDFRFV